MMTPVFIGCANVSTCRIFAHQEQQWIKSTNRFSCINDVSTRERIMYSFSISHVFFVEDGCICNPIPSMGLVYVPTMDGGLFMVN